MSKLLRNVIRCTIQNRKYCSPVPKPLNNDKGALLISCKRKNYDHYTSYLYDNLDEVPLASKGWAHSKSKGDFFTIHPLLDDYEEPKYSFSELGVHPDLIEALKTEHIINATEFQARAIQAIKTEPNNLLAAETGCGKTVAYLLPLIQHIFENKSDTVSFNTPKVLVLVPNRELAYQVGDMACKLGKPLGIKVKTIVGGTTKQQMMNPTFDEIDIVVATPGVIGKLSTVGIYRLNEVKYTVLDEADTLLDDSFIDRMTGLMLRTAQSQYILVSATVPRKMPHILAPIESNINHVISPKIHKPLLNITQKFLRLTASTKSAHLLQITKTNKHPMLVFTNKNQTCNWLAMFLRENGVSCSNINGDMNFAIRIDQWNQFVKGKTKVLAATDVGSRGLNTIQVRHVLNYNFPLYAADYLHRIGRVGRLGSPTSCQVTNFVTNEQEMRLVQQIELAVRKNQPLPNVDGNITNIVQKRIEKKLRESL